jgi:hypothetical protein
LRCGLVRSNFGLLTFLLLSVWWSSWCSGSGGGTRTRDAAIMSRVLCQLSYTAEPPYGLEP